MNKLIQDGQVAVIYTYDYGAGWSSWNPEHPEMVFDPTIAEMVLKNRPVSEIRKLAKRKYPQACLSGAETLSIYWVPVGVKFYIQEYDGLETVVPEFKDKTVWHTA